MPSRSKFTIFFAPETLDHLALIPSKYHSLIHDTIHERLTHAPEQETRNRKPLEPPAPYDAGWELRFGPHNRFRVFYDIDPQTHTASILAIGIKEGNRLIIGKQEFEL
jgi:mRNA-degrading endonuclease RelE of RelBE toxin-antitoxin system